MDAEWRSQITGVPNNPRYLVPQRFRVLSVQPPDAPGCTPRVNYVHWFSVDPEEAHFPPHARRSLWGESGRWAYSSNAGPSHSSFSMLREPAGPHDPTAGHPLATLPSSLVWRTANLGRV